MRYLLCEKAAKSSKKQGFEKNISKGFVLVSLKSVMTNVLVIVVAAICFVEI